MLDKLFAAGTAAIIVPAIVAVAFCVVALVSLTARRPATRRHCLAVLSQFCAFIEAARGRGRSLE